jgi:hypothetical protein
MQLFKAPIKKMKKILKEKYFHNKNWSLNKPAERKKNKKKIN